MISDNNNRIWNLERSGDPQGPAILWLHGFMGSHRDWSDLVENHFRDFNNIIPDLPGHGKSKMSETATFPILANDLFAQISKLSIDQFTIIGYSMGGRFGLHFQKRYPCHVASIVGLSIGPGLKSAEERAARLVSDANLIQKMKSMGITSFLKDWYTMPIFQSIARNESILSDLNQSRQINDPEQLEKSLRVLGNGALYSLWDYLPQIEVPVLLLSGKLDQKYRRINEQMKSLITKSQHEVIDQGDHAFYLEKPLETAILIRTFLRNLNKGEHRGIN
jgi:2-succinyl-6-hydroxy-2,4-cyclohexadiene-1-carboxylate synthase